MQSNNFPRIYSLSTIGIKQHFNADYRFHPYRTDFSGDSGSGKSMIADMIQLILAGSSEFRSSTDANKERDVKGMLLALKGKLSSRGYTFLNIEVNPQQFIVIGAYIESTMNFAEMFIIQNGYDWDKLTPLTKPISYRDLIIDDNIETLKSLCEKINSVRIKSFRRRNYHQILYNNEIISLDLTKDETRKTFANILRSFSRGKGFKTESENLKKFLFGEDEQNSILEKYNEEVSNINNDFHEHKRYLDEIELINEKQILLKTVLENEKRYRSDYSQYLMMRYNYWNTIKKNSSTKQQQIIKDLEHKNIELKFIENELIKLEIKTLEELLENKTNLSLLKQKKDSEKETKTLFFNLQQSRSHIETVEQWLKVNNNQLKNVIDWYFFQINQNKNKQDLKEFTHHLKSNNILETFEKSNWFVDFEEEEKNSTTEIQNLEKEISELESLSKFSDAKDPESLLRWAIENLDFPVSHIEESVLIYFQKYGRVKPFKNDINRYVPFPEELFENIETKIKDKTENGFWLNLDGVYEYIKYSPNQILNIHNPKSITESLLKLKEGVKSKLSKVTTRYQDMCNFKKILFGFGNLKEHIELYKRKDELDIFEIEESLKEINENSFEKFIELYKDKENIIKQYDVSLKDYENILAKENRILEYEKRIKQIEDELFKKDVMVDIPLVNTRIHSERVKINENEVLFSDEHFSIKTLRNKYAQINNAISFWQFKHQIIRDIDHLNNDKELKSKLLETSKYELDQTHQLNDELFNSKITFNPDIEELGNPDIGGNNSFKYKADQALAIYQEHLKIVTKDFPNNGSVSIGQLANHLLPTIFPSSIVDEHLISNNIVEKLSKLTRDIQEIGSRKVEILGNIFNEVYKTYSNYLTKINEIDTYLKKKNKIITGGNRASLSFKKSSYYPDSWLVSFRRQLNNQMNNTGLFSELKEEIDINDMMIKAFRQLGGNTKVEPRDLMDPKSYFDLVFDLKLDNDEINSGSNGQTYTANALLCLARLSLIEEKERKGIKIMPIDEAEGLGSNYDMLHELAKKEKYQIVTMAIETAGDITDDGQYIYVMNENNLADMESFVPPFGIFSNEVFDDIDQYINNPQ